jgi:hypothetical protein
MTECNLCGACCVALDISTLGKKIGVRCEHLRDDVVPGRYLCAVYKDRPKVCRDHTADDLCDVIAAPTLDERVAKYRALFDL